MRGLLITDIDSTLIDSSFSLFEEVRNACLKLSGGGWDIMVATGRIYATAIPYIRAIESRLPAILYDGCRVMDPETGGVLWERGLDAAIARRVAEIAWNFPLEMQIMGDESITCRKYDGRTRDFFSSIGMPLFCDLASPAELKDRIFRIIFYGEGRVLAELSKLLCSEMNGLVQIIPAGDGFLDVLPLGVSKGIPLGEVLSPVVKGYDVIVAVGDHENDLALLERADLRAATADAVPSLMEIADVVMPPAGEKGFVRLAEYLRSFVPELRRPSGKIYL